MSEEKRSERQKSVRFPWLRGDRTPRLYIFPYTIRTAMFEIEPVGPSSQTWPGEIGRQEDQDDITQKYLNNTGYNAWVRFGALHGMRFP